MIPPHSTSCHLFLQHLLCATLSQALGSARRIQRKLSCCSRPGETYNHALLLHTGLLFQPRLCSWLLGLTNSSSSFNNSHLASCSHSPLTQMGKQESAGMFATLHCDVFTSPHPKERDCASFFSEFPVLDVELMRKLHWYLNERLT